MTKPVPQDMQDVINEVSTTDSGRGDLANQYKVLDTIIEDSLKDANVDITITGQPIKTTITDEYGFEAELTPLNETRSAIKNRLCGGMFSGTVPDANIYTTVLTGSATATIADKIARLRTLATANSTARLETVVTGQYTAAHSNMFRTIIALDNPTANNIRRWGATTVNDGYFFYLNGTTFGIGSRKNGVETLVPQANFNGDKTFVMNNIFNTYEIYYTSTKAYFTVNGNLVHTLSATTINNIADLNLKPAISNFNSNGSISDVSIYCITLTISRFGPLTTNPFYKNLVGAGTYTLKNGAGRLHSIMINGAGVTGQLITIYDNTSATGTKIGTVDISKIPSPLAFQYNAAGIAFSTGLTIVIAGATVDITVIYE